jgi:hypothetical protein
MQFCVCHLIMLTLFYAALIVLIFRCHLISPDESHSIGGGGHIYITSLPILNNQLTYTEQGVLMP